MCRELRTCKLPAAIQGGYSQAPQLVDEENISVQNLSLVWQERGQRGLSIAIFSHIRQLLEVDMGLLIELTSTRSYF